MNWTTKVPSKNGFYWCREPGEKPFVVERTDHYGEIYATGSDVPIEFFEGLEFSANQIQPPT